MFQPEESLNGDLGVPNGSSVTPYFNPWEAVLDAHPVHALVWRMAGSDHRRRRETRTPDKGLKFMQPRVAG